MILGRISGVLWGTRTAAGLASEKLVVVRPLDDDGQATGAEIIAVDRLDAGAGDRVIVAVGSRVRDLTLGSAVPTKAVVAAVVDDVALATDVDPARKA